MITLVVVDVQNDFVSGTMKVNGAKEALESIKDFIQSHRKEIDKILFTCDWHPYNHCSFKKYGGKWPSHCVQFTPGACIEPKLLKFVQNLEIPYQVSTKGEMSEVEQYGAFEDIDYVQDYPISRYYFDSIVEADANTDFVICGIAGDYCVKATIQNLLKENIRPQIFMPGVVSIDGGIIFKNFIKLNNLQVIC